MSFCINNVKYNPLGDRAKIISMLSLLNVVCEMLIFVASAKSSSQFQVDCIMQDTEMLESITQSQYLVLTPLAIRHMMLFNMEVTMSVAMINTRAAIGVQAPAVSVEAHISTGLPGFTLVGLPEATVKEAKDRVRSAIINCGFTFPAKRITVNLAPADLPKEGGRYDLPIAIAILIASEQLSATSVEGLELLGELGLSGALRRIQGAIPAAMAAQHHQRKLIAPEENEEELGLLGEQQPHLIANHLLQVCDFLSGESPLLPPKVSQLSPLSPNTKDMRDIIGQEQARRALEIAATGGHNLLLLGPPGTGKTMLASRLNSILPPLTTEEALESAAVASLVHQSTTGQSCYQRPFRTPHHSASMAALIGGGSLPRPGEISLAHNGVLFLDELPEFERRVLDALREPLESGEACISRALAKVTFPARVQLVAAMNPSPTGHYKGIHARTPPQQILKYLSRLSGPFLDRFDLSIEVPLLPAGVLSIQKRVGESSEVIRQRVCLAREKQYQRSGKLNAHLAGKEMDRVCSLSQEDAAFLEQALEKMGLSVRAWHRILKVARSIADLAQSDNISRIHIAEALSYRSMDRLIQHLHQALQ